ncbi:MAG: RNA polymerase sigma factor [Acidobacteria bacterium]|nr:RNA polymerase sigma factor [Acidobacteriota bacterium]
MAAETAHIYLTGAREPGARREEARARAQEDPLAALVARARSGDAAAFGELMSATEQKVVATAWRFLGEREDARDAAQEVYLRAYKYLARFRAGEDFGAWLHQITVNVCRDAARRRAPVGAGGVPLARVEIGEAHDASFENASPPSDAERDTLVSQQRALLRRALAMLPEKERAAVVLRDMEGRSTEEVARLLNSRPVTVRSQVSSARTKLKAYCERLLRKGEA